LDIRLDTETYKEPKLKKTHKTHKG
jgi:hypothetical protein